MAETFRYCPMCEELVLDCNIRHHESECSFIKEAYQMPEHKLRQILENKINRLKA